jgi:hypothetical protein
LYPRGEIILSTSPQSRLSYEKSYMAAQPIWTDVH